MTLLVTRKERIDFNDLVRSLELTKGNLSHQLRKLEDAGYVDVHKGFVGRMPRTTYRVTAKGRRDFTEYLEHLEEIIAHARAESSGGRS
jgi:DNA-binding HxlR family transcriptional regulator